MTAAAQLQYLRQRPDAAFLAAEASLGQLRAVGSRDHMERRVSIDEFARGLERMLS